MLEAVLLVLESVPTDSSTSSISYAVTGHSGDSPEIPFLSFEDDKPSNEQEKYVYVIGRG
tara:strand:- start:165 stop:344 length:180 start_codon:yes stop_codon:yes gene_type:complete